MTKYNHHTSSAITLNWRFPTQLELDTDGSCRPHTHRCILHHTAPHRRPSPPFPPHSAEEENVVELHKTTSSHCVSSWQTVMMSDCTWIIWYHQVYWLMLIVVRPLIKSCNETAVSWTRPHPILSNSNALSQPSRAESHLWLSLISSRGSINFGRLGNLQHPKNHTDQDSYTFNLNL